MRNAASRAHHLESVREEFDKSAASSDRMAAIHFSDGGKILPPEIYDGIFRDIDARLHIASSDTVLEIGAGSGLLTERIAARCRHLTATDISPNILKLVPTLANVAVTVQKSDQLDFSADAFDKVVCYSVAQYFPDMAYFERAFAEQLRVLKPGGLLFLGDLFNGYLEEAFRLEDKRTQPLSVRIKRFVKHRLRGRVGYLFIAPDRLDTLARTAHGADVQCFLQTTSSKPLIHRRYRYDALIRKARRAT